MYIVKKRDGKLSQLLFGGQCSKKGTGCFEDKGSSIQKMKMNCLILYYFWCKSELLENKSIFDVLDYI